MVYMLLGTGFEETEAIAPLDLLRRADIPVQTVGVNGKIVYSSHGVGICADIELQDMDLSNMEMIILPGGLGGVNSVRASQGALNALRFAWEQGRKVAAICAGPTVLAELGITDGKEVTCFPSCEGQMGAARLVPGAAAVIDGRLTTGTSAGCAIPFGLKLIEALKGPEEAERIAKQIVIR